MDAKRFDALTRALSIGDSRRQLLSAGVGGLAALLGMAGLQAYAAKSCKGLKGKKKKKCLAKLKKNGCKKDADCPDQIDSCRNGRCERVCPAGACPGCAVCLIRYEADRDRTRLCAGGADVPAVLTFCANDTDCPQEAPLCISFAEVSCTEEKCGVCATSSSPCGTPLCQIDADCTNRTDSCQGGQCRPVCPTGACPGCAFCTVGFTGTGSRTQVCADGFAFVQTVACTSNADCSQTDDCVRLPPAVCAQAPCDQCVIVDICP